MYPRVMSEGDTLALVAAGKSIARFGDGELKLCHGRSAKSQGADPRLQRILRQVLLEPGECIAAIPRIAPAEAKADFWAQYNVPHYTQLYGRKITYGSAFITRPDSAPSIDTPEYWDQVRSLWRDRDVVLVRGSGKSLLPSDMPEAMRVDELVSTAQDAFRDFDQLFGLLHKEQRRVILCLGATATALAWKLAQVQVHAIDLGHIGMFLRRVNRGEPARKGDK